MARLPTDAESLRRIESSVEKMISDWERNAEPILEAYRELERYIQNLDFDRLGNWTADDRLQADRLPLHRQMLVIPSDLSSYVSAYTDHLFVQLDNYRDQALESSSIANRVQSALADLIDGGADCLRFVHRRRESSEGPPAPKSGVRRIERDRIVIAANIAQECLNVVRNYLSIAGAPAVQRADPEIAEAIYEDVRGFGWNQSLRHQLEAIVERSTPSRVGSLHFLKPFADQQFLHEWDAWSDSASELAIYIAHDLWKVIRRCEQNLGAEEAWGHYTMRDGLLFERLRNEGRFRDIPIDRLGRCLHDEMNAWEKANQQPASLDPATSTPAAPSSDVKPVDEKPPSKEERGNDVAGPKNGWHRADETPPDEFKHGPLTGQRKQLAAWIMGKEGADPRNLDRKLGRGVFWGRQDERQQFSVWFKVQKRFAEANGRKLAEGQRDTNKER